MVDGNCRLVVAAYIFAAVAAAQSIAIEPANLKLQGVKAESVTYKGRRAIRITDAPGKDPQVGAGLAILPATDFQDGVIEVDLTGDTLPGAPETSRGFTGIAFHVMPDSARYESFYLRPKNGRSEDQLQRNHSAQYIANPDFPWAKLREETPGKYETYVDIVPGEWTKMKIEVHGVKARLYGNGAQQPVLIVNDLKHGIGRGAVALWIGPGTVAHFANLAIRKQ